MSGPMNPILRENLLRIVGPSGLITDPSEMRPYLTEWRGRFVGVAPAVVRPAATAEVAEVVRLCGAEGVPIVPQGGNTSLVGGSIPFEAGAESRGEIVLSLSRMNRIRDIDPLNDTITVEAGCILRTIQDAAAEADRLFPLSLGAEGTCQIGGNLSTNAGGTMTLRYGNMRELVLGLEVVLPDGRIWDGLRRLRKNNTGYDLKHLFIGAEGTLGIITAAVLKLFPRPRQVETGLVAVRDPAAALELLARLKSISGDAVTAFELMPRIGLDFALAHVPGTRDPLSGRHGWYVLTELTMGNASPGFRDAIEAALADAFEAGLVLDATLAATAEQARHLWLLREALVEAQKFEGGSIKHDVSVPVSSVPRFIAEATRAVEALIPGVRVVAFGHVGDGNIHFNLTQPTGVGRDDFLARWDEANRVVHDIVLQMDGSISAEHGIGRFKRDELARVKSAVELDLIRGVKGLLDPRNLMNPGKMLRP